MPLPGFRKLSPGELASLGLSPRSERYMTPSGGQISKRQYLTAQRELTTPFGRVSLERYRQERKATGADVTPQERGRAQQLRFARSLAAGPPRTLSRMRKEDRDFMRQFRGRSVGQILRDPRFKDLWQSWNLQQNSKGRRAKTQRTRLLRKIGLIQRVGKSYVYIPGEGVTVASGA